MWIGIIIIVLIVLAVFYFLQHRIETLESKNKKMKFDYESKIIDILGEIKRIENKYATSGTEMCRYLDNTIALHNRLYFKYKNELNMFDN